MLFAVLRPTTLGRQEDITLQPFLHTHTQPLPSTTVPAAVAAKHLRWEFVPHQEYK